MPGAMHRMGVYLGLTCEQVLRVFRDIESKRRATLPLHLPALTMEAVEPIAGMIEGNKKNT